MSRIVYPVPSHPGGAGRTAVSQSFTPLTPTLPAGPAWDKVVSPPVAFSQPSAVLWSRIVIAPILAASVLTVGLAAEVDAAQPIAWAPKIRIIGQAVESDIAQAITILKSAAVNQAVETDLSQPITSAKALAVAQALETDTAQLVAAAKLAAVGQALETDLAQPVTISTATAVGQALEADLAQSVTIQKALAVGLATETDLAQSITSGLTIAVGQATETDLAQAVTSSKVAAVGQATETDLAQTITIFQEQVAWNKVLRPPQLPGKLPTESRIVLPTITELVIDVGQALETDSAQSIGEQKAKAVGLATETDLAQQITSSFATPVGQAVETDLAQAITHSKLKAIGQAVETDLAQEIVGLVGIPVGQALETDLAQPVTYSRTKAVGQALETDEALSVSLPGAPVWGKVLRPVPVYTRPPVMGSRVVVAPVIIVTLGQAIETDEAFSISVLGGIPPWSRVLRAPLRPHTQPPILGSRVIVAPVYNIVEQVVETDTALPIAVVLPGAGPPWDKVLRAPKAYTQPPILGSRVIIAPIGSVVEQAAEVDEALPISVLTAAASWGKITRAPRPYTHPPILGSRVVIAPLTGMFPPMGQALEVDEALPITIIFGESVTLGLATETDLAQPIKWAPKVRVVGLAEEDDSALPIFAMQPPPVFLGGDDKPKKKRKPEEDYKRRLEEAIGKTLTELVYGLPPETAEKIAEAEEPARLLATTLQQAGISASTLIRYKLALRELAFEVQRIAQRRQEEREDSETVEDDGEVVTLITDYFSSL